MTAQQNRGAPQQPQEKHAFYIDSVGSWELFEVSVGFLRFVNVCVGRLLSCCKRCL